MHSLKNGIIPRVNTKPLKKTNIFLAKNRKTHTIIILNCNIQ